MDMFFCKSQVKTDSLNRHPFISKKIHFIRILISSFELISDHLRLNLDKDPPITPHSRDLGILGFRGQGLGFQGLGFRVQGLRLGFQLGRTWFRGQGSVQGELSKAIGGSLSRFRRMYFCLLTFVRTALGGARSNLIQQID